MSKHAFNWGNLRIEYKPKKTLQINHFSDNLIQISEI